MPKKHSIIGDSISTFEGAIPSGNNCYYDLGDSNNTGVSSPEDTWWMKAIQDDNGEFLANASWSGSMVEGEGFPAGQSLERAEQILGRHGESPDVVWVFYGINDYGWGGYTAQLHGHANNAPKNVNLDDYELLSPGNAPKDAAGSFGTAYENMLKNIAAIAPDAEVRCLTLIPGRLGDASDNTFCYSLRGISVDEYNDEIRAAAKRIENAKVVDIRKLGFDYSSIDGTHPNRDGMEQIAALINAALKQDSRCLEHYPGYLRSRNTCDKQTCIGCPYAESTDIAWSCVCNRSL